MIRFVFVFTLTAGLLGCASKKPSCTCEDNPCHKAEGEKFPIATILQAYQGSALGKFLPEEVQFTPAKVLYHLLEDGNPNDAMAWRVGNDPEAQWPDQKSEQKSNQKEAPYSGYIEVFPSHLKKGAQCRKFIQKITMHTKKHGTFSFEGHGESCKRRPSSWVIVKEIQL